MSDIRKVVEIEKNHPEFREQSELYYIAEDLWFYWRKMNETFRQSNQTLAKYEFRTEFLEAKMALLRLSRKMKSAFDKNDIHSDNEEE